MAKKNKGGSLMVENFPPIKAKTANLIPYARNSRTHSEEQINQICGSIKEFGFTNPIIVDEDNNIIAGHGRVLAAQKLKIEEVPCVQVSGWSEAQKKAYIIADNKLALNAGWDESMLALEFEELQELGFDLSLTGFSEAELGLIIGFDVEALGVMPELKSGDKEPFQNMTFTLSDDQAEQVCEAIKIAKSLGAFVDTGNENSNGNALSRICETFVTQNG